MRKLQAASTAIMVSLVAACQADPEHSELHYRAIPTADSDSEPEDWDAHLQIYANNHGVSIEEAREIDNLTDVAGSLQADLIDNKKNMFAGMWLVHEPDFRIVIATTSKGVSSRHKIFDRKNGKFEQLRDFVDFKVATYSLRSLLDKRDRAHTETNRSSSDITGSGIDIKSNQAVIYVSTESGKRALSQHTRAEHGVRIEYRPEIPSKDALEGGRPTGSCMSGFTLMKASNGSKAMGSAGHCFDGSMVWNNNWFDLKGWFDNSWGDLSWWRVPNTTLKNRVWKGYLGHDLGYHSITGVKNANTIIVDDDTVCRVGRNTVTNAPEGIAPTNFEDCSGVVKDVWVRASDPTKNGSFIHVRGTNVLSVSGDSGGPYYKNHKAYGINRGHVTTYDTYITPVARFQGTGYGVWTGGI